MSMSTIRGRIENFSPKPDKGHYGVLIDTTNQGEQWFNGDGDVPSSWEKNDKIKLKVNKHEDTEIQKWYLPEKNISSGEGSEGGSSSASGSAESRGGGGSSSSANPSSTDAFLSKDRRIMLQCALKEAARDVRHLEELKGETLSQGERLERASELTNGYFNLLEAQVKDKSQNGGGQ